jgi:predicted dehydrogenase
MGRLHAERLRADGRGDVLALFDEDRSAAESLRRDLAPDAAICDNLDSLLDVAALDAAVICTPTTAHFGQVQACRGRGLHVLCEKPLADTRERIATLIEESQDGGPLLAVGYQRRHWATFRTLRREVLSGRWGKVQAVTSHNVENWQQSIAGTWRDDPAINPGGFITDAGSHKIDAVVYVTGLMPIDVVARTARCGSRVEITATVAARLDGDVSLAMDFVGNAQFLAEDLHIHCERADLMIRENRLWIGRNGHVEPFDDLEQESKPVTQFLDVLLDGAVNTAPADCTLPVFDLTCAILESGDSGRIVVCRRSQ